MAEETQPLALAQDQDKNKQIHEQENTAQAALEQDGLVAVCPCGAQPPEETAAAQQAEPAEWTEPMQQAEPEEPDESVQQAELAQQAEWAEMAEEAEWAEPAQQVAPIELPEPVQAAEEAEQPQFTVQDDKPEQQTMKVFVPIVLSEDDVCAQPPSEAKRLHPAMRRRARALAAATVCALIIVALVALLLHDVLTGALNKEEPVSAVSALVSENEVDSAAASSSAAGSAAAEEAWALLLANEKNPLPEGYAPTLASMGSNSRNGEQFVDARIQKPLQAMLDAARADGIVLIVRSAYRSTAQQTLLFNSMVQDYMAQYEYDYAQAYAAAKRWRNVPGTSEHETGLAVDLVGEDYLYADLTSDLAQTDWAQWLAENAAQYGFILRYPQDKTAITGTSFEPWHYRYVGVQAAEEIARQGVCLEEYLDAVQSGAQK